MDAKTVASEPAIDYVLRLPELTVSTLERIVFGAHDSPMYGFVSERDHEEYKRMIEEIVRRCNQYMPLVRRYKKLLDETNRGVFASGLDGAASSGTCAGRDGEASSGTLNRTRRNRRHHCEQV